MGKACLIFPRKGKKTFKELHDNFGYKQAAFIFNRVTTDQFINKFRDSLTLDSEGIPTFASLIRLPIVSKYVGEQKVLNSLNSRYKAVPNTAENVNTLINEAIDINKQDKEHIAIVDYTDKGELKIKIVPNNEKNQEIAESQRAINEVNNVAARVLNRAHVTIEHLSSIETAAGQVGVTNFNHIQSIADEFTGIIKIANNLEGVTALSEEFSHFLVRVYKDTPLMQRTIDFFTKEKNARKVLGEQYDQYYEKYNGDIMDIAEEAAGKMLRDEFLNATQPDVKTPLFTRIKNYITGLFRGINAGFYHDSIRTIKYDLSSFAKKIIKDEITPSKEQVMAAKSSKKFYALSEKGKQQQDVIKSIITRLYTKSKFTQNTSEGEERIIDKNTAADANALISKDLLQEETMKAIATLLDISQQQVADAFKDLEDSDKAEVQDKFIALRNTLYTIQTLGKNIEELYSVLSEDFFEDTDILNQHFMMYEENDKLKDFRVSENDDTIDTSKLTPEQIAKIIVDNSDDLELVGDGYYRNKKTGAKYLRATQLIQAYVEGHIFDENSPWVTPSTNVGTGMDELTRDFLSGRLEWDKENKKWTVEGKDLEEVYPNATNEDLNKYVSQLAHFRNQLVAKGIKVISRDVTVGGVVDVVDDKGNVHKIHVAGTLDLLGYDKDGNWYIYDMKTHRSKLNADTKRKYARQVSLYKKLLEDKYGIKISKLSIIPIKVSYPTPKGVTGGDAVYTISTEKPEGYNGREGNQLMLNGTEFKDASPYLEDVIELQEEKPDVDYKKVADDPTGGLGSPKNAILEALKTLNDQYAILKNKYNEKAFDSFASFLEEFYGSTEMAVSDRDGGLKKITIRDMLKRSDKDITLSQKLFTTMANNPDGVLQLFDAIVRAQRNIQRQQTIDMSQRILALAKEYEDKGITNYDWMFEDDNRNYIRKILDDNGVDCSYDKSAFDKAKNAFWKTLDVKYGQFPEVGSKEYEEKLAEQRQWVKDNSIYVYIDKRKTSIPSPTLYPSKYSSLSSTKQEFYDKWMELKHELDILLPPYATTLTTTIKIRKETIERTKDLLLEGNIKGVLEDIKGKFIRKYDDPYNYEGVVGVTGEEENQLPIYYIKGDTHNITHDVISSLIAYADMTYSYANMHNVINQLEIGKSWMLDNRDIGKTRGGRRLKGRTKAGSDTAVVEGNINTKESNFGEALNNFFASKIYEQYQEDNGEYFGVDTNKAASTVLKLGSFIQLGFNFFANAANLVTGLAMQNIEAAAGEYFNARELASADATFMSELPEYLEDVGARIPTSKLALFCQMFNIKQDFRKQIRNKNWANKMLLLRIFGPKLAFIGQEMGDFWLYLRPAIIQAKKTMLHDNNTNTDISLWDALIKVPINENHPEYGYKLVIKEGVVKKDGTEYSVKDIGDFEKYVGEINRNCFGIYNSEDTIAARRYIWGNFLMQYRDWIPSQFRYRFGAANVNLNLGGKKVEGYYITTGRFLIDVCKELKSGEKSIVQVWDSLDDTEKANIKRAVAEVTQLTLLHILSYVLGNGSKIKDRPWIMRFLLALIAREKTELGALTIGPQMPREAINILKSPVAATSVIDSTFELVTLLNPFAYDDIMQSGRYAGHSRAYKAFMNSPLNIGNKVVLKAQEPETMYTYYTNMQK